MWTTWWLWMAGGLILGIMEVLAPTFILLGFAIGAFVTGGFLYFGGGVAFFSATLPYTLVFFAVVSVVSWLVMRMVFGVNREKVKTYSKDVDIND
ncbi:NfeD family protein [Profundibacter sp.]